MSRAIVTYAAGAHEELLDVALPTFRTFAERHGYDLTLGRYMTDFPPAWNKVPNLINLLEIYDEVVWLDCDLVIVDPSEDFPPMSVSCWHSLVRHFEDNSEVPNSGVWRLNRRAKGMLREMMVLEVFENHGWWEQAALMTLMGYCVPPQGHEFKDTKCRCVRPTESYYECDFMRLCWNSHPNYRAEKPKIVHCSYPNMTHRLEVMRELVRDPNYNYPKYGKVKEEEVED